MDGWHQYFNFFYFFPLQVPKVTHTEFCQGRTMRWALAWSFYDDVMAPVSANSLFCCHGSAQPLVQTDLLLRAS